MVTEKKESPLVVRAQKDFAADRSMADEASEASDVASLHAQVIRLLNDRKQLAEAFNALIVGWNLMNDSPGSAPSSGDAVAALERVATEAMGLAKDVVRAFSGRVEKS